MDFSNYIHVPKTLEDFLGLIGFVLIVILISIRNELGKAFINFITGETQDKKSKTSYISLINNHNVWKEWLQFRDLDMKCVNPNIFVRELSQEEQEKRLYIIGVLTVCWVNVYSSKVREYVSKIFISCSNKVCKVKCSSDNSLMLLTSWMGLWDSAYKEFVDLVKHKGIPDSVIQLYDSYYQKDIKNFFDNVSLIISKNDVGCHSKVVSILDSLSILVKQQRDSLDEIANLNGEVSKLLKDWEVSVHFDI